MLPTHQEMYTDTSLLPKQFIQFTKSGSHAQLILRHVARGFIKPPNESTL